MTLHNHFHLFLDEVRREGRYRVFTDLERHASRPPYATWRSGGGSRSNDYLGMGRHPAVIDAMVETAQRMGAGAGGTRNISGNSRAVVALEAELADLHSKQAALAFSSGYVANEAALGTVRRLLPNCLILSDEKNHASRCAGRSVSRRPLARIPAIIATARRRSVPKIVLSHCASQGAVYAQGAGIPDHCGLDNAGIGAAARPK
jgi:7-keto-8-aminopelargonate synthetase-like enzyme